MDEQKFNNLISVFAQNQLTTIADAIEDHKQQDADHEQDIALTKQKVVSEMFSLVNTQDVFDIDTFYEYLVANPLFSSLFADATVEDREEIKNAWKRKIFMKPMTSLNDLYN